MQVPYFVMSEHHIPDLIKDKIDQITSSMTENGLHSFFKQLTKYLTNLQTKKLSNADEDFRALTMEDLNAPITVCLYLLGFALIVFTVEVIIYRIRMRS